MVFPRLMAWTITPLPIARNLKDGLGVSCHESLAAKSLAGFAVSMCVEEGGYDVDPVRQSLSNWDELLFFRAR